MNITPEILQALGITKEDILDRIAEKAIEKADNDYEYQDQYARTYETTTNDLTKKLYEEIADNLDKDLKKIAHDAINKTFNKRNIWGEPISDDAQPTVLEQIIERTEKYFNTIVDSDGKPKKDNWGNKLTMAEYLIKDNLDERFSWAIQQNINAFKKEVSEQIKQTYDKRFNELLVSKIKK